ncbi:MAG: type I glyceraldehyde-3-phosphate dehydrogenase [Patescibacteria group bacterium]|nr:type I glyceraldehyde-3-phosphate dehydrogenase [Patescibacteria group bacterium]MBU2416920.1 type I glyceraldehyde-3-phosphate dehydrogenase [Patescibacteria group bacterium]
MKKIRVAINGFGRIGRAFTRLAMEQDTIDIVAINDLNDIENFAYLLKYDTAYGKSGLDISIKDDNGSAVLTVNGKDIVFLSEKDPACLPWKDLNIDVVLEATGFFTEFAKAKLHLDAGASRVVISAPGKGDSVAGVSSATVLMGINEESLATCQISSNASCTTNASSPVIQILNESVGVEKALLNTVHGYTATQKLVDSPDSKDWRRGRAAAQNIIPSTTGAAKAVTKVVTDLEGKFDGIALRVPVITGSVADITFVAKRDTSVEEINEILQKAADEERWKDIFTVAQDPIVSSDIVGNKYAAIIDPAFTRVVGGNLVKVLSWYDNEMGYSHTLIKHIKKIGEYL